MKLCNIKRICMLLCILLGITSAATAQSQTEKTKRACVLDITKKIAEIELSNRNVYSAEYMMEVAGIPYFTATSLSEAMEKSSMIIISSEVKKNSFTTDEVQALGQWVENGGILVSPAVSVINNKVDIAEGLKNLFGIQSSTQAKSRYTMSWVEKFYNDKELEYIDQPEERTISLGQAKKKTGESMKTFAYTLQEGVDADILALFDDGTNAVIRRSLGKGTIYLFGYLWRDIIQRAQLNKDFEAQRKSSNAFEPSADVTTLFVRSAFNKSRRLSVWKFTIPDGYESLIIPTHDCDSRTAYDSMYYMSEYERDLKFKAHYFLTVHYFRDSPYLSAFYDDITKEKSRLLIRDGHTVGSHSICHYPDFSITERFPLTVVTREEYAATTHHATDDSSVGISTGGSTWAEVVLSKQIIEENHGNHVRSFRTGHLCMNDNIPEAEQIGGYNFASCFAAGDVMSEFPYRERLGRAWTGDFNGVLEMPLHISDVISASPINENNWMEKPDMWHTVQGQLQGNYAPAILLIHPNRKWKMQAEKMLVEMTDLTKVGMYNFEDFGDFWNARRELDFDYAYNEDTHLLEIFLNNIEDKESISHQRFALDITDSDVLIENISIINSNGEKIADGDMKQLTPTRLLISAHDDTTTAIEAPIEYAPSALQLSSLPDGITVYNLAGQKTDAVQKGINIIRYANGSVKKVMIQ